MISVFVSCTTRDMGMFRGVICDKPREWWGSERGLPRFQGMSDPKAESIPPVEWSMREASRADVIVLLLGDCHGELAPEPGPDSGVDVPYLLSLIWDAPGWADVDQPERFSYTQWEVLAATAARRPFLVFSPDKDSADADLNIYRKASAQEGLLLLRRQACFAQWVRSQYTEDHFKNRADLLNKVRAALQRIQQRRYRHRGILAGATALAVLLTAGIGVQRFQSYQIRQRELQQRATTVESEMMERRYAVAVGSALAILGRSPDNAGRPVFNAALEGLGLPSEQIRDLAEQYKRVEQSIHDGGQTAETVRVAAADLLKSILAATSILMGERPLPYIEFGLRLSQAGLLVRTLNTSPSDESTVRAAEDNLAAFRQIAKSVDLPTQLADRIQELQATLLATDEGRLSVLQTLDEALDLYDMHSGTPAGRKEDSK